MARAGSPLPELLELTPFSVFCGLHLGITETDGYAEEDARSVARRFDLSEQELLDFVESRGLTESELRNVEFDLDSARIDIEVAPDGISRTELARTLFDELCEAAGRKDWAGGSSDS